jgi:hypothetical protein
MIAALAMGLLVATGCDKDDGPTSPTTGKRDVAISLGTASAMFFGTTRLGKGVEEGSDFFEHHAQCAASQWGNWLFVLEPMSSGVLYRYDLDEDKAVTGDPATLSFGAGSGASHITVLSETLAYVSLANLGRVVAINPSTMAKLQEIDLSQYAAGADGSPEPTSSIARDGLLFVALAQRASVFAIHDTAGSVAVIDIESNTVQKIITDARVKGLGGIDESNACTIRDENGDIYFYSNAVWGYQAGIPDGFLRIKNGETEFDSAYFFSLKNTSVAGVPGEAITYGLRFAYAGDGIAYSSLQVPGFTSNPPDYVNDRNYQPVRVDLRGKTITKLPVPPTDGHSSRAILVEKDGTVLFGQSPSGGKSAGLYRYSVEDGTLDSDPVLETSSSVYFIFPLD